jgi:indole-3-glycerol phosphate synthase
MSDFLNTIRRLKEEEIAVLKQETPIGELRGRLKDLPPARDFREALRKPGIALIAEVKKSSPSAGIIAERLEPISIAREYEGGGASAISVLTESTYFGGELADLTAVKEAVKIPVLRKDFIIDHYQIYEARAAGADAILLIAELLDRKELADYLLLAHDLGLSCLVESHSRGELEKAIRSGAEIIGVNNRNLQTLTVNLDTSIQLIPFIPPDRIRVSESGIKSVEDVESVLRAGADAILVGETLVRSKNPSLKIGELIVPTWCFYKPENYPE